MTGDFSNTTTPVSIVNGRITGVDGFASEWFRNSDFYRRYSPPIIPPKKVTSPKRILPKNSLGGSGIYQIEVNKQFIDVTVDSNGRSSVNNKNVDEKVKVEAQKEAEKIFRDNFAIINNEHLDEQLKKDKLEYEKNRLEHNASSATKIPSDYKRIALVNFVNKDGDFVSVVKDLDKGDSYRDFRQDTSSKFSDYYLGANVVSQVANRPMIYMI